MAIPNSVRWQDLDPKKIEDIAAALISRLHPETQRIDGAGGDGGRDIQVPEPDGLVIYEVKSFCGRLDASRREQIKRSLKKAKALDPKAWHLVVPVDMTPGELQWYNSLIKIYPFVSNFTRGRTWLDGQLSQFPEIVRYYVGDSNSEIVEALRQMGQERAVLAGGIGDAVDRIRAISARLNEIDPHYTFRLSMQDGQISVAVHPRYKGAELDRPITIKTRFEFPLTPQGRAAAEHFQDALNYGVPGYVSSEYIRETAFDAPQIFGENNWSEGTLRIEGYSLSAGSIDFKIVTTDPSGRTIANLPMKVDKRYQGNKGAHIELVDHSGFFRLTIRTDKETRKVNMTFNVRYVEDVLPSTVLPAARFWASMTPGNKVGWAIGPSQPSEYVSIDEELLPDGSGYYAFLSALARVQEASGVFFPIPAETTQEEENALRRAQRLLDGEVIRGTWTELVITITREGLERWWATNNSPEQGVTFKAEQEALLHLAGRDLSLGRLERVMVSARIVDAPDIANCSANQQVQVRLVPGEDASFTSRLLRPEGIS